MANKETFSSILYSHAQSEIIVSWKWYEERQFGLGDKFLNEVLLKIQSIENQPELFPVKIKSYRETVLPTFPIVIIYRINKKKKIVRIISIFHTSRNYKNKYR